MATLRTIRHRTPVAEQTTVPEQTRYTAWLATGQVKGTENTEQIFG